MSVPYGAPQQQPGAPGPAQPAMGLNLGFLLPLVAAGLALIAFLLAFADDVAFSGVIEFMYAAGVLAGLSVLPKAPRLLWAAAPLTVVPTLAILQGMIKGSGSVQGMQIVLFIVSLLQTAAVIAALLAEVGILKLEPKPANPYGQPGGWNPPTGGFPPQGQQHPQQQQQYGQQPQQAQQQPPTGGFGAPVQPQQPGAQGPGPTTYLSQPGQFGGQQAPPNTPPGGFGGPPQQS
ncbi:DUF5336 domain-containing protein [Umezawaea sp. Da 62-37]|uniref:DUF5336 domain-containing protein n=1 Tax=Umezawaea sp. Da 62-37 TaxID=3075927 RepID=UPI0028F708BA|nr:DUF5336 domain-containing protein [Umezawaea sp. Da 62-37]WNV90786.1 DUF5336 domain-containing protein [Umezawaea sp. Da 62-37]